MVKRNRVGIINFHYEKTNFGANFVAFALQEIVKKLGFNPEIINFNPQKPQDAKNKFISESFYKFKDTFLDMTNEITDKSDLWDLNFDFDSFITGSDQVWNAEITRENTEAYYLDFVDTSKIKLSYAASVGRNVVTVDKNLENIIKNHLDKFDAISVREKNAVDTIKKLVPNKDITDVLDPTLLLDEEYYNKVIESEAKRPLPDKYFAFYFLADRLDEIKNYEKPDFFEFENQMNCQGINCYGFKTNYKKEEVFKYNSFSDWLNTIKNAEFVVTDSFHGICFSIIYKKNFVYKNTATKLNSRILNLLDKLEITNKVFNEYKDLNRDFVYAPIDYDKVYKKLSTEREKSVSFLKASLNKNFDKDFIIDKLQNSLNEKLNEQKTDKNKNKKQKYNIGNIIWKIWCIIFKIFPPPVKTFLRKFKKNKEY